MAEPATPRQKTINDRLIDAARQRLAENKRLRRTLPQRGRVHIDRQLPFLCVYRRPSNRPDIGTEALVKGEASYLIASGAKGLQTGLEELIRGIAATLSEKFGAFLIVEIWSGPDGDPANMSALPVEPPVFRLLAPDSSRLTKTIEVMAAGMQKIKVLKREVDVEVVWDGSAHPPELLPLLPTADANELNITTIGLEVPPVYRNADKGEDFPAILQSLRKSLSLALRRGFFEFARSCTKHRPPHFHALGRRAVVKAVWQVDEQMAEVSNAFDYLLQLTPINSQSAWSDFRRSKFQKVPVFHYRPLPMDAGLLKRKLFNIPLERIEDPTLHELFRQKQDELEQKITMLENRDTPRFLYGSLQLFGALENSLLELAIALLQQVELGSPRGAKRGIINSEKFAERARQEIAYYHERCPEFTARAVVTSKVSNIIVSRGRLLIARDITIPRSRIDAVLAHEIGTHLLTYYNGRVQPFRQLYAGLPGYEELQEGLAVLAEYLVGGLSRARMRQLAARVVTAKMRIDGASFVEAFRNLQDIYGFRQRPAFNIASRVYRGGGLTKDIVYLRGLRRILKYVQDGGAIDPLLVGKIAVEHIPVIRELRFRGVLKPPPLSPRYLEETTAARRLALLRGGSHSILDLVESREP